MFKETRLTLTAWYLLIIMLISIAFSVVIYQGLSHEIDRYAQAQRFRIERRLHGGEFFPPELRPQQTLPNVPIMDPELVEETKHRLLLILIAINGGILIISGGLGYFLAGRTLQPIKDMLDEQNQFITDASHELRTPLTSLKSSIEVNLRDKNLTLNDAKASMAESIEDVNRLQLLSEELLQLAQYQKPNAHTKFERLSLNGLINQAMRKIEPLARQKNIVLENVTGDIDIDCNKYGLIDLLVILLDNAVKYSPQKGKITIISLITDGSVRVSVKDQGIGIDKKDLPHIFDRFYRADAARTKTDAGGYGLGLPIANKIADIHHGNITVESKVNVGSSFTVQLPIRHAHV